MSEIKKAAWIAWLKAAGIRAIKTFAQTLLATIPVGISVVEVEWTTCLGIAALACILSLLTSLAGLPEAESPVRSE
jgi:hypothetical protein